MVQSAKYGPRRRNETLPIIAAQITASPTPNKTEDHAEIPSLENNASP
jgi:hypothetical protein